MPPKMIIINRNEKYSFIYINIKVDFIIYTISPFGFNSEFTDKSDAEARSSLVEFIIQDQ